MNRRLDSSLRSVLKAIGRADEDLFGRVNAMAETWERSLVHTVGVLLLRGLHDAESMRVCRDCGCTEFDPCESDEAGPCHWVDEDLCSACIKWDQYDEQDEPS